MNPIKNLVISKLFPGESLLKLVITPAVVELQDPADIKAIFSTLDFNSNNLNQVSIGDEITVYRGKFVDCSNKKNKLDSLYPNIKLYISNKIHDERIDSKDKSNKSQKAN